MPFLIRAEQKQFKFTLSAQGLPVAECERWGGILYCLCCPLCGFIHEIRGATLDSVIGEYQPVCIAKVTHSPAFLEWQKGQPESISHSRIMLKLRQPIESAPANPQKSIKRQKKTPVTTGKAA